MTFINLICIRASNPSDLARFYGLLGMEFVREKHGSGPVHYSCALGGSIFEIYPRSPSEPETRATRIGFSVDSINHVLDALPEDASVISSPKMTAWGYRAVIQDPEGHKIELLQSPVMAAAV